MQVPWGDVEKAHSRAVFGRRLALRGGRAWASSAGFEGPGLRRAEEEEKEKEKKKEEEEETVALIEPGGRKEEKEEQERWADRDRRPR
jgi:hypothetical protein